MKFSHMHLNVTDLDAAVAWFERIGRLPAGFRNDRMASIAVGDTTLILDRNATDSEATVAFASTACDSDYAALVGRGAEPLAAPEDLSWGVRAAYVRGPGRITIELEQPL
jgi:hypothetical protein